MIVWLCIECLSHSSQTMVCMLQGGAWSQRCDRWEMLPPGAFVLPALAQRTSGVNPPGLTTPNLTVILETLEKNLSHAVVLKLDSLQPAIHYLTNTRLRNILVVSFFTHFFRFQQ